MKTKKTGLIPGFKYDIELVRKNGEVIDFSENNIVPTQGFNLIASLLLALNGVTPTANWYVGLINSIGYVPAADAILSYVAGIESSAYTTTANARKDWDAVYDEDATITNVASKAEFVFPSAATVTGVFLTNTQTRGAHGSGTLLSVAQFSTPREIGAGDTLRITAGLVLQTT